jgi:hypothetical protein
VSRQCWPRLPSGDGLTLSADMRQKLEHLYEQYRPYALYRELKTNPATCDRAVTGGRLARHVIDRLEAEITRLSCGK